MKISYGVNIGTITVDTLNVDLTSTNTKLDTLHTDVTSTNTKLDTLHTDLATTIHNDLATLHTE